MTMISDLSWDLVEEILLRVPMASLGAVRSTCKTWNALSKARILCKAEAKHQFLGFMIKSSKLCSMRLDLGGVLNEDGHVEFGDPCVKEINSFNQVKISEVLLCDGLLLLRFTRNNIPSLMVWNPYLDQTRLIQPRTAYFRGDTYVLGYDNSKNRNHKILRYVHNLDKSKVECEIYDFKYDSWRVLDLTIYQCIDVYRSNASVKGNIYFFNLDMLDGWFTGYVLCFDFTTERFGQLLHLPVTLHPAFNYFRALFSLREEKLVASFMDACIYGVSIWVTTKIEPNEVLWSKFLKVDLEAIPRHFDLQAFPFFIEEEKKLAVVFNGRGSDRSTKTEKKFDIAAYIIGENKFLKTVVLGETDIYMHSCPVVCSNSYVPSLLHIKRNCTTQKEREEEEASQQSSFDLV